jgi:hypothetical protein
MASGAPGQGNFILFLVFELTGIKRQGDQDEGLGLPAVFGGDGSEKN